MIKCFEYGCNEPVVGQCPGDDGPCGKFYCATHSHYWGLDQKTVCEDCHRKYVSNHPSQNSSSSSSSTPSRPFTTQEIGTISFVVVAPIVILVMFVLFSCNTMQRWLLTGPNESQMRNDLIGWKMESSSLIWSINSISDFNITTSYLRGENDVLRYEVRMTASVSSDSKTETWTIQCKPVTYQIEGNVIQGNAWKLISKQTRCGRYP